MANQAYKCPKCEQYIIGVHCFKCNINVHEESIKNSDVFKDLFGKDLGDFIKDFGKK